MNKIAVRTDAGTAARTRQRPTRSHNAASRRVWRQLAQLGELSSFAGNYVDARAGILAEREAAVLDTIIREPLQLHYVLAEDGTIYEAGGPNPPDWVREAIPSVQETIEHLMWKKKIKTTDSIERCWLEVATQDGETDEIWYAEVELPARRLILA